MTMKRILLLLAIAGIVSCQSTHQEKTGVTIFENATVYDGNGNKLENANIIVSGGRIECVGECDTPQGASVVDLSGKFVTPGIVDAHVHFFQTGFFDSRPDAMDLREIFPTIETYGYQASYPERYYEAYLKSGVTAVYDVGGMPWSIELQEKCENDLSAPHVAAAGPLITPASPERIEIFNNPVEKVMVHLSDAETGKRTVRYNSSLGSTGIKIWGVAIDDPEFISNLTEVANEVERTGNKLIVHSTPLAQAKAALGLGARLLVHSVEDQVVDEEFIQLALENNTYYNPTMIVSRGYLNATKAVLGDGFDFQDPNRVIDDKTVKMISEAPEYAYLVDTAALRSSLPRRENRLAMRDSIMAANALKLHQNGVKLVVGTDAGNPGTLHGVSIFNEMEAMQRAGISAEDLIVIATRNGAETMERATDFGTIENGKMADLIVLEKDPGVDISAMRSVLQVMRGGKMIQVKN